MNIHKNARLTPQGRALLVTRVQTEGWQVADAAVAAGVSERTAFRWLARHRAGGECALQDRSSAPARCPHRTNATTVAAIERLRRERKEPATFHLADQPSWLRQNVEAMKVVHPGPTGEAGVANPTNNPGGPRMNIHKNARLTPQGRALLVTRVQTEGWQVADPAVAVGVSKEPRFVGWHGIGRAASVPSRTAARRPPDAPIEPTPRPSRQSSGCGANAKNQPPFTWLTNLPGFDI